MQRSEILMFIKKVLNLFEQTTKYMNCSSINLHLVSNLVSFQRTAKYRRRKQNQMTYLNMHQIKQ
jgi:hypothetical protein